MKANEAPEKIWIDNLDEGFWFDSPSGNKSIEYSRTDAFIEKAVEYIKDHLFDYWSQSVTDESKFIDEFRKYMEREEV